uniref:Uncharacterized protein n=1 Tax=Rhipicephalus zambeziensis TaxID=60191 RepID=A0A224YJS4_9ACAR
MCGPQTRGMRPAGRVFETPGLNELIATVAPLDRSHQGGLMNARVSVLRVFSRSLKLLANVIRDFFINTPQDALISSETNIYFIIRTFNAIQSHENSWYPMLTSLLPFRDSTKRRGFSACRDTMSRACHNSVFLSLFLF